MTEAEFDDLLRRALIEAVREDYAPVLAEAEVGPPPDFSPRYRRRRLKMLNNPFSYVKRATRTAWRKVLHSAACILLVAALAFGGVMAVSPTARAWVQEVFMEWFETYTRFTFTGNPNAGTETGEWKTGYLPEGFEIERETVGKKVTEVVYKNSEGILIYLTYISAADDSAIGVDNENRDYVEFIINGNSAYLMKAKEDGKWNNLILLNKEEGIRISIKSSVDSQELIRMAENIVLEK